jgi:hypothetical protein
MSAFDFQASSSASAKKITQSIICAAFISSKFQSLSNGLQNFSVNTFSNSYQLVFHNINSVCAKLLAQSAVHNTHVSFTSQLTFHSQFLSIKFLNGS